jgi:hypothetical protein
MNCEWIIPESALPDTEHSLNLDLLVFELLIYTDV